MPAAAVVMLNLIMLDHINTSALDFSDRSAFQSSCIDTNENLCCPLILRFTANSASNSL